MDQWTKHDQEGGGTATEQPGGEFGPPPPGGIPPYGAPFPPYPPLPPVRRKRKWAAGLLSFLLPGLGHFYAGAMQRGLFFMLLFAGNIVAIVLFAEAEFVPIIVLLGLLFPVIFFYSLFDALQTTDRVNQYGGNYSMSYGSGAPPYPYEGPGGSAYRRSISGSQIGIGLIVVGALIFLAANKPVWIQNLLTGSGSFIGAVVLIAGGAFLFITETRKNK